MQRTGQAKEFGTSQVFEWLVKHSESLSADEDHRGSIQGVVPIRNANSYSEAIVAAISPRKSPWRYMYAGNGQPVGKGQRLALVIQQTQETVTVGQCSGGASK